MAVPIGYCARNPGKVCGLPGPIFEKKNCCSLGLVNDSNCSKCKRCGDKEVFKCFDTSANNFEQPKEPIWIKAAKHKVKCVARQNNWCACLPKPCCETQFKV